jgi:hypothetical protein
MLIKLNTFKKKKISILHSILRFLNKINSNDLKIFSGIRLNGKFIDILRKIKLALITLTQYLILLSDVFIVKSKIKILKLNIYSDNYKQKKKLIANKINLSSKYKILGYKKSFKSKNYFPNIFLYEIKMAQVFGDTSCVLTNGYLLYDDIQNLKAEHIVEENFLSLNNLNSAFFTDRYNNSLCNLNKAISLLNPLYNNYAHFITEILPLIIYIKKNNINNIPILINDFKNKNILNFLRKIFFGKNVYIIKDDQSIFVQTAFIFSKVAHVSHAPKQPKKKRINQGTFSEPLLNDTNKYFSQNRNKSFSIKKKIYIIRPKTYRYLLNQEIIISILKKAGYFILDPYKYGIERQIFFFQNAQIIISPTGASLANLVFCLNRPKIIILAPNLSMIFNYWRNLAHNRITDMTYILSEQKHSNKRYHNDYSIIPNEILKLIN